MELSHEGAEPIPSLPGYFITRDGRVWSEKSHRWRKTHIDKSTGRVVFGVFTAKGIQIAQIHRSLLETFIGPCPEGMECRHLDGDPLNNNLGNLKWGTRYENMQDKIIHNAKSNIG